MLNPFCEVLAVQGHICRFRGLGPKSSGAVIQPRTLPFHVGAPAALARASAGVASFPNTPSSSQTPGLCSCPVPLERCAHTAAPPPLHRCVTASHLCPRAPHSALLSLLVTCHDVPVSLGGGGAREALVPPHHSPRSSPRWSTHPDTEHHPRGPGVRPGARVQVS